MTAKLSAEHEKALAAASSAAAELLIEAVRQIEPRVLRKWIEERQP